MPFDVDAVAKGFLCKGELREWHTKKPSSNDNGGEKEELKGRPCIGDVKIQKGTKGDDMKLTERLFSGSAAFGGSGLSHVKTISGSVRVGGYMKSDIQKNNDDDDKFTG